MLTLADEVRDVLQQCRDYAPPRKVPVYMSIVIKELEGMLETIEAGQWESRDRKTGLGYIILDDYAFARSELGLRVYMIADVWAGDKKWEVAQ